MIDHPEIDRLAAFLLERFPDEPGRVGVSESAVDVAIRLLSAPVLPPAAPSEDAERLAQWCEDIASLGEGPLMLEKGRIRQLEDIAALLRSSAAPLSARPECVEAAMRLAICHHFPEVRRYTITTASTESPTMSASNEVVEYVCCGTAFTFSDWTDHLLDALRAAERAAGGER